MNDELMEKLNTALTEARTLALQVKEREVGEQGAGDPRGAALVVTAVEDAILRADALGRFR